MQSQQGQLVTPEAVVLQVPHAGPGTRIAARGLDMLLQSIVLVIFDIAIAIAARGDGGGVALVVIDLVGAFLVVFGYPAIMETTWRGRTLGKAAFGLRVVTRQGAPIRFRHAAIRSALYLVDGILLGPTIGILCLLLTRDTVRVGDMVAGTIVIRERSGATLPTAMTFPAPYGYEDYVATLDVSVLTSDDYSLIRGYLLRTPRFAPQVRYSLAVELANPVAAKLRLTAPAMHPEAFLMCVAAASQRRYGGPWGYGPAVAGGYGPAPAAGGYGLPPVAGYPPLPAGPSPAGPSPAGPPPAVVPTLVPPEDSGFAPPS
jgi:uncharacterized RDD family membrane protein YckC